MNQADFIIEKPQNNPPMDEDIRDAYRIVVAPDIVDWINNSVIIPEGSGYSRTGKVSLDPWQLFPLRKGVSRETHEIAIECATQLGKSFVAEMILLFKTKFKGVKALVVYENEKKIPDIVTDRLQPIIEENCKEHLTGVADDLKSEKITLKNSIIRTGSANIKGDMSTHAYQLVYGSEVSKWQKKNFDQMKLCKGRFTSVMRTGDYLFILESSPFEEGDLFDVEIKRIKTRLLPFVKCPHCRKRFFLEDKIIKEVPNQINLICDHNPDRILAEKAAYCECPNCKGVIGHNHHYRLLNDIIWSTEEEIKADPFKNIQNDYGKIPEVVFHVNKLYTIDYTFSQCLHNYFSALYSPDHLALDEYNREDMARPKPRGSGFSRMSETFLVSKVRPYFQYGESYPDAIQFAIPGIDVMDSFMSFVLRGFCPETSESWMMRADRIEYDPLKINAEVMKTLLNERIFNMQWRRDDETLIPIIWGFIDIGHRQDIVLKAAAKIPVLHGYKGDSRVNCLIKKSEKEEFYLGNSEQLSKLVEKLSHADTWYLPDDWDQTYVDEFLGEFWQPVMKRNGTTITEFVKTEKNHYRSCENYIQAAVQLLNIQTNPDRAIRMARRINAPKKEEQKPAPVPVKSNWINSRQSWLNR
jgi:phage terminase large subunit GpA-like protein